jgi:hypothetical protein
VSDTSMVVRMDAIVAGLLLRGAGVVDQRIPKEGELRASFIGLVEAYFGYGSISRYRLLSHATKIPVASAFEKYSSVFPYLFRASLDKPAKASVRRSIEDLRLTPLRRRITQSPAALPTGERLLEVDRRQDPSPLGVSPEIMMISALSAAVAADADEVLQWVGLARSTYGYAWRAHVDWRHIRVIAESPKFMRYLKKEDDEANAIEQAIDRGEFPL